MTVTEQQRYEKVKKVIESCACVEQYDACEEWVLQQTPMLSPEHILEVIKLQTSAVIRLRRGWNE